MRLPRWRAANDAEKSVLVYERIAKNDQRVIVALNFAPVPRMNYRVGVQRGIVQQVLRHHPLVMEFFDAADAHLGATIAILSPAAG